MEYPIALRAAVALALTSGNHIAHKTQPIVRLLKRRRIRGFSTVGLIRLNFSPINWKSLEENFPLVLIRKRHAPPPPFDTCE